MHEADIEMQHCGEMSNLREEVRHSSALLGGYNTCSIAKLGPKVSSTHDECSKPFAICHLESFIVIAKWN